MNWYLVVTGFLVHLIFFYSIFDIYFSSPLVHGMTPQHSTLPAPAKRIVLFVADGLRADKVFELDDRGQTRAPFLRNKILHKGAWGVSHTHVPTESRPGHVAIIAGFYEDVSAVTKGWKENPVEFDSVFNESRTTWSWGSPDILPMFAKGATGDHVHMHMYPGHNEDFAGATLSNLDTWVFDQVTEFLESAKWNDTVRQLLSQDKLVFFLHLLGLDTNGHAHRPYSYEYLENIRIVDEGINRIVRLFEERYDNDGNTAYIFTADHGMTNWGSHGAGDPSETLTPLVAWGAGIRSAQPVDHTNRYHSPEEWKLNDLKRSDVSQADICPLMATLIGVPIPLQSVGTVPLEYLSGSGLFKANTIFSNAKQILEQFKIKRQQRLDSTLSALHQPFKSLSAAIEADEVRQIQQLIQAEQFDDAIMKSRRLIDLALEGLSYYHNYDRVMLGASIACSFVGWMAYIVTLVLEQHTDIVVCRSTVQRTSGTLRVTFGLLALAVAAFLLVQSQHWTYYIYLELPVLLWFKTFQRFDVLRQGVVYLLTNGLLLKAAFVAGLGFAGLEIIILSFFYRELLTVGFLFLAVWSLFSPLMSAHKDVIKRWCVSLVLMAVFPMLPVVGRSANYSLVYVAGFLAVIAVIYRTYMHLKSSSAQGTTLFEICRQPPVIFTIFQILVLLTSVYVVWRTAVSLGGNTGLPFINQCLSWAILVSAFFLPLLTDSRVVQRLSAIELAFLPSYLLLSTSHEGLFYVGLCLLMMCWLQLESQQMSSTPSPNPSDTLERLDFAESTTLDQLPRKLVLGDLRCAYFFIFFLLSAFFGTGNIASINSFDPASVLCFVTVFNPFVMGSLMLWKILIPFLVVTCTFNAIHVAINVPTQSLFFLVLLMSDFMAVHFFFLVRDYGSWLDIGMSISHYVIVMAMICFLFLLLTLSKFFTDFSLRMQAYRPSLSRSKPHRL